MKRRRRAHATGGSNLLPEPSQPPQSLGGSEQGPGRGPAQPRASPTPKSPADRVRGSGGCRVPRHPLWGHLLPFLDMGPKCQTEEKCYQSSSLKVSFAENQGGGRRLVSERRPCEMPGPRGASVLSPSWLLLQASVQRLVTAAGSDVQFPVGLRPGKSVSAKASATAATGALRRERPSPGWRRVTRGTPGSWVSGAGAPGNRTGTCHLQGTALSCLRMSARGATQSCPSRSRMVFSMATICFSLGAGARRPGRPGPGAAERPLPPALLAHQPRGQCLPWDPSPGTCCPVARWLGPARGVGTGRQESPPQRLSAFTSGPHGCDFHVFHLEERLRKESLLFCAALFFFF